MKTGRIITFATAIVWGWSSGMVAGPVSTGEAQRTAISRTGIRVLTETFKTIGPLQLTIDLYYPPQYRPEGPKLPAIVFFFGGGWNRGDKSRLKNQAVYLARQGMIAACAQYRTKEANGATPAQCLQDAKSAMRFVYREADRLGIARHQIAAGGSSAGGHLAAATAFCPGFDAPDDDASVPCRPKALILLNPVIDNGPGGFGHERVKAYWKNFSPLHNIGNNPPPVLFMAGDRDRLIPVATAKAFQAAIEKHGGYCDLRIYPDGEHGFYLPGKKNGYYKQTLLAMTEFMTRNGFIPPARSR